MVLVFLLHLLLQMAELMATCPVNSHTDYRIQASVHQEAEYCTEQAVLCFTQF